MAVILPRPMRLWWLWTLLLAGGLAMWYLALPADPERAWRAVLVNFIYFVPLAAGLAVWPAIVILSHGRWGRHFAPTAMSAVGFGPVSFAALAALWLTWGQWAPWHDPARQNLGVWLEPNFIFGRDLAALVLLWVLTLWFIRRWQRGQGAAPATGAVIVFCLAFTLIAFDLVMGLDVKWYSTLFGGYFFMSGLLAAVAAWTLLSVWRMDRQRVRDMGNLVLAFSILTTYMMFSQLLPIWFENLPQEVRFVAVRMNVEPWKSISLLLLATVYLGPLALLIWRGVKFHRGPMTFVALYVLVGAWIERWWEVTPTVNGPATIGQAEIGMTLAFASALVLSMWIAARFLSPQLPPEEQP
jgi:hypothetical protein